MGTGRWLPTRRQGLRLTVLADRVRLIEHHRLGAIFEIECPLDPAGPIIDVGNPVQDDLRFVGHRDFSEVVEKITRPLIVLLLQRENARPVGRASCPDRVWAQRRRSGVDEVTGLLHQGHRRAEPRRIDLHTLRRAHHLSLHPEIDGQVRQVPGIGFLPE
jgi:hypothetical protein